jgi:hypothetical protein
MLAEMSPAEIAGVAESYVRSPRLASEEFATIVAELRTLHCQFEKHVAESENLEAAGSDSVGGNNGEALGEWPRDSQRVFNVRQRFYELFKDRTLKVTERAEVFCCTIGLATKANPKLFELVKVFQLAEIVCYDVIPIGHQAWWERIFRWGFKHVEANFRTFATQVAFDELRESPPEVGAPTNGAVAVTPAVPEPPIDGPDPARMILVLGGHEFGPFTPTQFDVVQVMWENRESAWSESNAFFTFHQKWNWSQADGGPFGRHQTTIQSVFERKGFGLPWKRGRGAFVWCGLVPPKAKRVTKAKVSRSKKR